MKFGMRVPTWDSLPQDKFCKNFGQIYTKKYQFWQFKGLKAHIFKATTMKLCMMVRTWDSIPKPNLVKIA